MAKKNLIYIHIGLSSFVRKDIEILSKEYILNIHEFDLKQKKRLPLTFFNQLWMLLTSLRKSEGVIIQFAGYQSYLPTILAKLFNKKCILVLGGTDTVSFPSIKYGNFYKKYLRFVTLKSLERADLLVPVSETLIECDYTYQNNDFNKQGYLFHAPSINTPVKTIYNGYNSYKWIVSDTKEQNSFVTIAADLGSRFGIELKGIDLILNIAQNFNDCNFYIVGGDKINVEVPENIILVDNIPHDELPAFISTKQFYLQLSISEGFPNALCEGMLSGCTPIVSNTGAMPYIIGETGYLLKEKDQHQLILIIEKAISNYSIELGIKARNRIASEFSIERREKEILALISKSL